MTCARYFDPEFRCDADDCYYAGNPERVGETFLYVDAADEERGYCDVCNNNEIRSFIYTCQWCRRLFCIYADTRDDPAVRKHARIEKLSYEDAYRAWYGCEVKGIGSTCWPCVENLGPDGADLDSPVRAMSEPERQKAFDFEWADPEDEGPDDEYVYHNAYMAYREQVCAVVYREDRERKAAKRAEQRAALKRIFPDLPEDRLRRMKRACKCANIFLDAESTTWDIACELSDYLADK